MKLKLIKARHYFGPCDPNLRQLVFTPEGEVHFYQRGHYSAWERRALSCSSIDRLCTMRRRLAPTGCLRLGRICEEVYVIDTGKINMP